MSGFHFLPIIFNVTSISQVTKSGLVVDEARQKLYSACEAKGVAITVMKPLGAGTLLKAESSPFGVAMTVPQCIQYCLDRNGVKVVIVGCHTVEEVPEAVKYYDVTDEERSYAHIFSQGHAIRMTGRCMHCNHCQPCPAHIDIAAVTKFLDLATQQDTVPETVAQHYRALPATADGISQTQLIRINRVPFLRHPGRFVSGAVLPREPMHHCLNPIAIVSKSPQSLFRTGSAGFCF